MRLLIAGGLSVLMSAACTAALVPSTPTASAPTAVTTPSAQAEQLPGAQELVTDLRSAGLHVERVEPAWVGYLSGEKTRIIVSDQVWVQVFEHPDEEAVLQDAGKISPDGFMIKGGIYGNTESMAIYEWIAPPHFFRRGRVIALYVGSDPAILGPLVSVMGPQFAGG